MQVERSDFHAAWQEAEPALRRALARRLPTMSDQDDVLQDTALHAWAARCTRDPDRPFAPWAWGITRRRLAAWHRERRQRRESGLDASLPAAPDEERESGLPVSLLCERLDIDARLAAGLLENRRHHEIGHAMGLSGPAISARLSRLRRRLRGRQISLRASAV